MILDLILLLIFALTLLISMRKGFMHILAMFLKGVASIVIAYFGAALFSLYIGYDIWRSQQLPRTVGNAVLSACEIYVDIINLFLRLLEILGHNKNN